MGFAEWWKTSSAKASAEHYALRFDADELNDLRGGRLSQTAREKFQTRARNYKKLIGALLVGCGIPLLIIVFPFVLMFGYGVYTAAGATRRSPIAWIWLGFVLLVSGGIVAGYIYAAVRLVAFKRSLAADLNGSRVGIEQGRVDVRVVGSQGSRKIQYWMNDAQFLVLGDAIGSEMHRHFQNEANSRGALAAQTNDFYRFYYLPQSKLILHYERL